MWGQRSPYVHSLLCVCRLVQLLWKSAQSFLKELQRAIMQPAIRPPGIYLQDSLCTYILIHAHYSYIHSIKEMELT